MTTITWQEFVKDSKAFLEISKRLGDSWSFEEKSEHEGHRYLVLKRKIPYPSEVQQSSDCSEELPAMGDDPMAAKRGEDASANNLIEVEYHIVFSVSYQVPVLYFNASRRDGSLMGLEDCWRIFRTFNGSDTGGTTRSREDMLSTLTQMEHPVLFRPFLAIHPCRTSELLAQMEGSCNRVLTFISLMGPYVGVSLDNEYGKIN